MNNKEAKTKSKETIAGTLEEFIDGFVHKNVHIKGASMIASQVSAVSYQLHYYCFISFGWRCSRCCCCTSIRSWGILGHGLLAGLKAIGA